MHLYLLFSRSPIALGLLVETRPIAILVSHEVNKVIESLLLITGLAILLGRAPRHLRLLLLVRIVVHVHFCRVRVQILQIHVRVHRTRVEAH